MIITISGKAESGKDTAANIFKEEFENLGLKVLILHYADYLKFICKQYYGWDGNKDEPGRTLLQYVGTDLIRAREPNFWVETIARLIKVIQHGYDIFIIPDTRFPNEIEYMKNTFGENYVMAINITRKDYVNKLTEEQKNHISETALDNFDFDGYISSESGIENLKAHVQEFMSLFY